MKPSPDNRPPAIVLSCEHAGNEVPSEFRYLFTKAREALHSHRGYDLGAMGLFHAMLHTGEVEHAQYHNITRLLIDVNRSLRRRTLFSEFSGVLTRSEKQALIDRYHAPFRKQFEEQVARISEQGRFVVHLSVHSFTPVLNGMTRNADLGLLYDPTFGRERRLAYLWRRIIEEQMPDLRVRMNYPYMGRPDGHVAALRRRMGPERYAGFELEMNQKFADNQLVMRQFADTLKLFRHNP